MHAVKIKFEISSLIFEVASSYLRRMNKEWFRRKLRTTGLTSLQLAEAIGRDRAVVSRILNGHQTPSLAQAKAFADVLGVEVSEVLVQAGLTEAPVARALNPGFSDSDAAAWIPAPGTAESAPIRSVAQALGERPGVDVWRVKSRAMALAGLLEGDFILVDTHQSERARAGDVVIAQLYSQGTATTILRRFEPPVLVAASADPADGRVHVVDHNNVVIRGKVIASWRA